MTLVKKLVAGKKGPQLPNAACSVQTSAHDTHLFLLGLLSFALSLCRHPSARRWGIKFCQQGSLQLLSSRLKLFQPVDIGNKILLTLLELNIYICTYLCTYVCKLAIVFGSGADDSDSPLKSE